MYSPEESVRCSLPSHLVVLVNTTVFAGMFNPIENVSVAKSTLINPSWKKDFNDLLENRKETTVMDANSTLEKGKEIGYLRKLPIVLRQVFDSIRKDAADKILLVSRVELELGHGECVSFAFSLAE